MFDLPEKNVPLNRSNSLASLSIPQTESMLSPDRLVSPVSKLDTQSLDGALGFVPQVDGSCFDQSFILLNGESDEEEGHHVSAKRILTVDMWRRGKARRCRTSVVLMLLRREGGGGEYR